MKTKAALKLATFLILFLFCSMGATTNSLEVLDKSAHATLAHTADPPNLPPPPPPRP